MIEVIKAQPRSGSSLELEEFRVGGGGSLGWSLADVYTSSALEKITQASLA
tara:strand:+ start:513 stop:665 length:153 start_codon:yes stop_codon:yes gene_type:complete